MKYIYICILLVICGVVASAQPKPTKKDSIFLKVYAEPDADSIRDAQYYEEALKGLKMELAKINYLDEGQTALSEKRFMRYIPYSDGEGCGCWMAKVAANSVYRLRYNHPGFEREERKIDPTIADKVTIFLRSTGKLAKTYGVNAQTEQFESFKYIPGARNFSETLIVYFKEGSDMPKPSENQEFLKGKALKDLQKTEPDISIRHVSQMSYAKNAFYVVLGLPDRRTMEDLLYFQENGDKPFPRGYYIGNDITKVIETLMASGFVEKAVPTFYNDLDMEYRMVNPNDYPKSKRLQRKLGDIYYEYEIMLDDLEKKMNGQ